MSIFQCEECGCVENTALSNYWWRNMEWMPEAERGRALCCVCSPVEDEGYTPSEWHGRFPRRSADGYILGDDGFLYSDEDLPADVEAVRIIGSKEDVLKGAKRQLIKYVKRICRYGFCNDIEAKALKVAAEAVIKENKELRARVAELEES